MRESRNLRVWQVAREFVGAIYTSTAPFPRSERFGLQSQLRRGAVSILANISEGAGRDSDREFARFLRIALGSASEVEALLVVSTDLDYLSSDQFEVLNGQLDEIRRMMTALLKVVSAGGQQPEARSQKLRD